MKNKFISFLFILFLVQGSFCYADTNKVLLNDVSKLNPAHVREVLHPHEVSDLQKAIKYAKENNLKVSIAGKRHSQGGHVVYDGAVVLDMREFNKVLSLDEKSKVIRVQSGATWEDVQNYANPYGLAVKVMQASNIFTVGGSLGSNVHGNDPKFGPIIETVKSFHFLTADGSVLNVNRSENSELFGLVIGGFGLLGVILDVDLELTENNVYEGTSIVMDYKKYPEFFEKNIIGNPNIGIHSAKLSIAPESLLKEIVPTTYEITNKRTPKIFDLQQEQNIFRNKFLFDLSRRFKWGKSLRWDLQKRLEAKVGNKQILSRNNAMRPIIKFLEYDSPKDTDILQEYFVPKEKFVSFTDGLRGIVKSDHINLTSVTIRYVPKNVEAYLSYVREDSFAFVLYINQSLSAKEIDKAVLWTRKLVDLALDNGGSYYLTYQLFPSQEQIRKAYPELDSFFEKKKTYDPGSLFMNKFYEKYVA